MKMKVKTDALKRAIQKYVERGVAKFERETEQYRVRSAAARKRYIENLAQYLADVKDGAEIRGSYELDKYLLRGCHFPNEPEEPNRHVDLLVKLDLAEDQILTVDDHSDYMKFLSGKCVCS